MQSERDRALEEFDRVHGLVNGKAPKRTGAVDVAGGIILAAFVIGVVAFIVWLIANR